jgi:hypothetical protein
METLYSETTRAEQQQRERAIQREHLINMRTSAQEKIDRLSKVIFDEKPLLKILALASEVDPDLRTHSGQFSSGGFNVCAELADIASKALADFRAKAARHQAKLDQARKDLARAEEALA